MNMIPVPLESTIKRMKREIIADVLAGHVPVDCASFASLHDHRDANAYGGFCDDELSDSMIKHFGGRDKDEGMPDGFMDYINQAQDGVDAWLRDGGLADDCPPPGWSFCEGDDSFNPWGALPYFEVFNKNIGGGGHPTCGLTVLAEDSDYRAAHGGVVLPERFATAKQAANHAMTWAVEHGYSNEDMKGKSADGLSPIPAFSESADHVMRPKATSETLERVEPATMFIARFDSRSFEFTALGATRAEAVTAMVDGLQAHTVQFGLEADWWGVADDLNVDECPVGGCLRDHALLAGPEHSPQSRAPMDVVSEGTYSGQVLSLVNGVVTQKINRVGDTVQHDASKFSEAVRVGDVVDIQYRGGEAVVMGIGKGRGWDR